MLLLTNVTISRTRPDGTTDSHGWTLPDGGTPVNLDANWQPYQAPVSFIQATDGDSGPSAPLVLPGGTLFLDETADIAAGDTVTIDGEDYYVRSVMTVHSPLGSIPDCVRVEVSRGQ